MKALKIVLLSFFLFFSFTFPQSFLDNGEKKILTTLRGLKYIDVKFLNGIKFENHNLVDYLSTNAATPTDHKKEAIVRISGFKTGNFTINDSVSDIENALPCTVEVQTVHEYLKIMAPIDPEVSYYIEIMIFNKRDKTGDYTGIIHFYEHDPVGNLTLTTYPLTAKFNYEKI